MLIIITLLLGLQIYGLFCYLPTMYNFFFFFFVKRGKKRNYASTRYLALTLNITTIKPKLFSNQLFKVLIKPTKEFAIPHQRVLRLKHLVSLVAKFNQTSIEPH